MCLDIEENNTRRQKTHARHHGQSSQKEVRLVRNGQRNTMQLHVQVFFACVTNCTFKARGRCEAHRWAGGKPALIAAFVSRHLFNRQEQVHGTERAKDAREA